MVAGLQMILVSRDVDRLIEKLAAPEPATVAEAAKARTEYGQLAAGDLVNVLDDERPAVKRHAADILKAMGLAREEVYISNIVKFRPATPRQTTNNRKPSPKEMASCLPFIRAEVEIVKPGCIIALGGTAAEGLLGINGSVGSMRGSWHEFGGIPVRVTYHPSYLLRSQSDLSTKRQVWEDMLAVMERLGMPISDKQRGFFLPK
jgi:uracil-DNA glycosylase family 4